MRASQDRLIIYLLLTKLYLSRRAKLDMVFFKVLPHKVVCTWLIVSASPGRYSMLESILDIIFRTVSTYWVEMLAHRFQVRNRESHTEQGTDCMEYIWCFVGPHIGQQCWKCEGLHYCGLGTNKMDGAQNIFVNVFGLIYKTDINTTQ